jgi:hypothetical protein
VAHGDAALFQNPLVMIQVRLRQGRRQPPIDLPREGGIATFKNKCLVLLLCARRPGKEPQRILSRRLGRLLANDTELV